MNFSEEEMFSKKKTFQKQNRTPIIQGHNFLTQNIKLTLVIPKKLFVSEKKKVPKTFPDSQPYI
jgi:hypothetical protein